MQDRHLRRGKRLGNGEWIYGQPHNFGSKALIVGDIEDFESEWIAIKYWWEVDPATVGQCTGLHAAKSYRGESERDRLIFEGDTVQYAEHLWTVCWDSEVASFEMLLNEKQCCLFLDVFVAKQMGKIEIVGIIHDQPKGE